LAGNAHDTPEAARIGFHKPLPAIVGDFYKADK
jgi:hypothetical protein